MSSGAARSRGSGSGWKRFAALLMALVLAAGCVGNPGPPEFQPSASVREPSAVQPRPPATADTDASAANAAPELAEEAKGGDLVPGQVVVLLRESERLDEFLDETVGGDVRLLDTIPELRAA